MEEISFNKRRKIGRGGRAGPTAASRARQVPAAESLESVEFTKEEVEALLNEEIKGKGKLEQISESNKKLRLCIKWFQGVEQSLIQEQEKLRSSLEDLEKKCLKSEIGRQRKEDELTLVYDMWKRLQEYTTSLQQYNSRLQTDRAAADATLQRILKEKSENLGTLRGHYASLQEQWLISRFHKLGQSMKDKQMIFELKERLAEAENQINEKEMLRRKLHNTIVVVAFPCELHVFI